MIPIRTIAPHWTVREPPLVPCAIAARGEAAQRLAQRVLELTDEALQTLRGVATSDCMVLLGERDALPWADSVIYLGRDPLAPSLLLPTTHTLDVPLEIFERALTSSSTRGGSQPPFAVFSDGTVVSLFSARPLSRAALQVWVKRGGDDAFFQSVGRARLEEGVISAENPM